MKVLNQKLHPKQLLATLSFCLFLTLNTFSQTVWLGGTPGQEDNWLTCSNWSSNEVPGIFDNVIIPNTNTKGSHYPVLVHNTEEISHLEIKSGAKLTIANSGDLTVNGSTTYNHGIINQGDIILDGQLAVINSALKPIVSKRDFMIDEKALLVIEEEIKRIETLDESLELVRHYKWKEARIALANYTNNYKQPQSDFNTALYNLGKTKMNSEDYVGALKTYKVFLSENEIPLDQKEEIEFYQALLFLNINEQVGKRHLTKIANDYAHNFQSNAKGILSTI